MLHAEVTESLMEFRHSLRRPLRRALRVQPQEQVTNQWSPSALISWTSSVTAAATSHEWQATPLATVQDSGQEQGDYRLAQEGSQGWPAAELLNHLIRPLQE